MLNVLLVLCEVVLRLLSHSRAIVPYLRFIQAYIRSRTTFSERL